MFAYWGGTFSEPNYRALRREESAASRQVVQLQREVDSLRIFRDSIATNPVVQERVARERWGMLRPGELTFSILPADSSPAGFSAAEAVRAGRFVPISLTCGGRRDNVRPHVAG